MADYLAEEVHIPLDAMCPTPYKEDPPTYQYTVSVEHGKLIRQAYEQAQRAKMKLADLEIDYQNKKSELMQTISDAASTYQRLVQDIAQAVGISASGGVWEFDMATLTYKRRP